MKIALVILGVVALALLVVVGLASTKDDAFTVQRSALVSAPPQRVFDFVDDFHAWGDWSPWDKLDPNIKRTFSGAPRGVGAVYEWEGDSKVGKGRMQITTSTPGQRVALDLEFIAPWKAQNVTTFDFEAQGAQTQVTWGMSGTRTLMMKVMSVFMDMDSMIGKDFEKGLASLKGLAEGK
jgi:uncharacterized protein YndB with AHSA1/START domain